MYDLKRVYSTTHLITRGKEVKVVSKLPTNGAKPAKVPCNSVFLASFLCLVRLFYISDDFVSENCCIPDGNSNIFSLMSGPAVLIGDDIVFGNLYFRYFLIFILSVIFNNSKFAVTCVIIRLIAFCSIVKWWFTVKFSDRKRMPVMLSLNSFTCIEVLNVIRISKCLWFLEMSRVLQICFLIFFLGRAPVCIVNANLLFLTCLKGGNANRAKKCHCLWWHQDHWTRAPPSHFF